ncbi:MAG: hypothetical protein DHS20C01_23830 [marine bacterium B5-7]|nr:MAG: hypothetical protein DHS20C01_23830 [marine bacterium B5-7]
MEKSIYKFVLKYTTKDQIYLLVMTLVNLPFIYISLEIPKIIINGAIGGQAAPYELFGVPMGQVGYLLALCFAFLGVIAINGGIKYSISVYSGTIGERMLMRFRYSLYERILRFPLPHFKRTSQGEIIPMVTAETEPLGGFIGEAFTLPAFQGGLLVTYLFFIFQQDFFLGLAAIALYPPQLWLIPRLQRKVNALAKRRVKEVRGLADRVGESISGINEIHAHDTSRMEKSEISYRLGSIYIIRIDLFKRKFFIKFLNNFLAQLTPFFFYSIGGYFVIKGELSLGAMVAVLAAYKDISPPWKELLKYYQTKEDIRVKYEQIIEQFDPENMFPQELQEPPETVEPLKGELMASNLVYSEDGAIKPVDGANFSIGINQSVSTVGATGSGKDELSKLIARLVMPTSGRVTVDGIDLASMPEGVLGRRQAYVGSGAHIFTGTIRGNLLYGLMHVPTAIPEQEEARNHDEHAKRREIARLTANSLDNHDADWIDYESANAKDQDELFRRVVDVLEVTDLERDVYQFGLSSKLDVNSQDHLFEHVLKAREQLKATLAESGQSELVESFDSSAFNRSMSVAENFLFGAPLNVEFEADNLADNPLIVELLKENDLYGQFCLIGKKAANIMLELFADAPPGDPLFEQFSFLSSEALAEYKTLTGRATDPDPMQWRSEDRRKFLDLPFKLVLARHRLGLLDEDMQERIVTVRRQLHERLGEENDSIRFLDENAVNPAITLQENVLFGTIVYGQANAKDKIAVVLRNVIAQAGLDEDILKIGLNYHVGSSGARLSLVQKQKLALARCLMKQPDVLIVNEAMTSIDPNAQERLVKNVLKYQGERGLIWVLERPELSVLFDQTLVMHGGAIVGHGAFDEVRETDWMKQLLPQSG